MKNHFALIHIFSDQYKIDLTAVLSWHVLKFVATLYLIAKNNIAAEQSFH